MLENGNYITNREIIRQNNTIRNKPKTDPASYNKVLQKGLSTLYRINKSGVWERLGYGLFTLQDIPSNSKVCYFFGDCKKKEDAHPFYSVSINSLISLDCYDHYESGKCMGSLANSPRAAYINGDINLYK